jgi:F0F1-type ATP synthase assembly protein I
MRKLTLALAAVAAVSVAGCQMSDQERMVVGGAIGAGAGFLTAQALGASRNWTIVSTLAGAAAGTLVARNQATGDCAYAVGDGTFRTGPCPR